MMTDRDRSETDDGSGSGGHHRQVNWDAITAITALFIGVIAILISAYAAWATHQQTRAQVWPHIVVGATGILPTSLAQNGLTQDGGGLVAANHGVGPAIVRRVEVLVNGKPVPDWTHLSKALGYSHRPLGFTSALDGRVFTPGQKIYMIAIVGRKDWLRFKQRFFHHVVIRTCYCSVLGNCWINTMKQPVPLSQRTQSVDSCSRLPKQDEFNG